jgi:hypothetical protein
MSHGGNEFYNGGWYNGKRSGYGEYIKYTKENKEGLISYKGQFMMDH